MLLIESIRAVSTKMRDWVWIERLAINVESWVRAVFLH